MKHVKYLLMVIIALSLGLTVQAQTTRKAKKHPKHSHTAKYQCPMKCEDDKTYNHAGKCPVCNMNMKAIKKDKATTRYQCPMKCEGEKTYATAGKCPACNMNLKPLSKEATAATYQCPMKCEGDKTYAAAGNCPVCKMKLKKNEGPHSHK